MRAEFIFSNPPFPSCHAASLAQTPAGLAAAWFGGSREGAADVEIWFSLQDDLGWSPPRMVASGSVSGRQFPCWNPVLFQEPGGPLMLFYKVGPSPDRWWGMLATSEDHGQTWSAHFRLPDGFFGPIKNKPLRLPDGVLICPSSSEADGWCVHIELTRDLGQSWERVPVSGDFQAIQPSVLHYPGDRLQLLCRSRSGWIVSTWSQDGGRSWSALEKIPLPNPNSGIDAVTLADGRQLLVYNHVGMTPGRWGGPRTPLNLAASPDGVRWTPGPVLENEDGEYSYPAVIQTSDGGVHIAYTWQRQRIRHVSLSPSELG